MGRIRSTGRHPLDTIDIKIAPKFVLLFHAIYYEIPLIHFAPIPHSAQHPLSMRPRLRRCIDPNKCYSHHIHSLTHHHLSGCVDGQCREPSWKEKIISPSNFPKWLSIHTESGLIYQEEEDVVVAPENTQYK